MRFWTAIPDSAPDFPGQYRGIPHWCYRNADGMELCHTFRLNRPDGKKDFVPLCFAAVPDGSLQWVKMAPPSPRPLYGLDRLAKAAPNTPILLVEGEKTADAAQSLFPDHVCMTWMGGSNATGKADFSPLTGRNVTIFQLLHPCSQGDPPNRRKQNCRRERAVSASGSRRIRKITQEIRKRDKSGNATGKTIRGRAIGTAQKTCGASDRETALQGRGTPETIRITGTTLGVCRRLNDSQWEIVPTL